MFGASSRGCPDAGASQMLNGFILVQHERRISLKYACAHDLAGDHEGSLRFAWRPALRARHARILQAARLACSGAALLDRVSDHAREPLHLHADGVRSQRRHKARTRGMSERCLPQVELYINRSSDTTRTQTPETAHGIIMLCRQKD